MSRAHRARSWLLAGSALPALVAGAWIMAGAGVGPDIWLQNVVAGLMGVGLWLVVRSRRWPNARRSRLPALLVMAALAATLISPGIESVHRWLPLGPLRIHAAALCLPAMIVWLCHLPWKSAVVVAVAIAAILFLQPDLAQAAAFAVGWCIIAWERFGRRGMGAGAAAILLAAATALRADPLEPVAHVEGIVTLAADQGPWLWAPAICSLLLLPAAWLLLADRLPGVALGAYFIVALGAAWAGHFPVPVLGYGVAPILGYYGAVAAFEAERMKSKEAGVPGFRPPA